MTFHRPLPCRYSNSNVPRSSRTDPFQLGNMDPEEITSTVWMVNQQNMSSLLKCQDPRSLFPGVQKTTGGWPTWQAVFYQKRLGVQCTGKQIMNHHVPAIYWRSWVDFSLKRNYTVYLLPGQVVARNTLAAKAPKQLVLRSFESKQIVASDSISVNHVSWTGTCTPAIRTTNRQGVQAMWLTFGK